MRALITTDTLGGVWTYTRELVTGLCRRGVEVTLVSLGGLPTRGQTEWMKEFGISDLEFRDSQDPEAAARLPNPDMASSSSPFPRTKSKIAELRSQIPNGKTTILDYRPTSFRLEWMQESSRDLEISAEYLQAVIDEVRPDIVHANQFCYGALPVDIPKIVVGHSDVLTWWRYVHGEAEWQKQQRSPWLRRYREIVQRGLAGATAVISPSGWMLGALRQIYDTPARPRVIYNGRTPELFCNQPSDKVFAVSAGRLWDEGKQVSLLRDAKLPLPVYVAGNLNSSKSLNNKGNGTGQLPSSGDSAPASLFAANGVHFVGQLSETELRGLFAEAALYIATSIYEPFGLAPLEAALSRCALVLNDIPVFRELWGENACYFKKNDAQSLAATLKTLGQDFSMREMYADRAYRHARRCYSGARMAKDYFGLYEDLVNGAQPARESQVIGGEWPVATASARDLQLSSQEQGRLAAGKSNRNLLTVNVNGNGAKSRSSAARNSKRAANSQLPPKAGNSDVSPKSARKLEVKCAAS